MFLVGDHVDDEADDGVVALVVDGFDHGVGVDDGGGFGGGDEEDFVGGDDEGYGVLADAGHGVDDDEVGLVLEAAESGEDVLACEFAEVCEFGEA